MFTHLSIDGDLGCFYLLTMNSISVRCLCTRFYMVLCSHFSWVHPSGTTTGSCADSMRPAQLPDCFQEQLLHCTFPLARYGLEFCHAHSNTRHYLSIVAILLSVKRHCVVVLIRIFLTISDVEHLLLSLLTTHIPFCGEMSIRILCPFPI